jgi:hypothetical protein
MNTNENNMNTGYIVSCRYKDDEDWYVDDTTEFQPLDEARERIAKDRAWGDDLLVYGIFECRLMEDE